jgi:hypothetical protein
LSIIKHFVIIALSNERKRKAAVKEMERLNRALKAQIYDLK